MSRMVVGKIGEGGKTYGLFSVAVLLHIGAISQSEAKRIILVLI